jgi:predicted DNA-binding protein (UPF0251 family)
VDPNFGKNGAENFEIASSQQSLARAPFLKPAGMASKVAPTAFGEVSMQPVPKTPQEALEVFRSPDTEDWERDYAALMIGTLDEALPDLVAMARDATVSEMLQQRAAEVLGGAWKDRGILMTADISGFTPTALEEILAHRARGSQSRG